MCPKSKMRNPVCVSRFELKPKKQNFTHPFQPSDSIPNDRPYVFVHHTAMAACNNTQSCTQAVKQVQVGKRKEIVKK